MRKEVEKWWRQAEHELNGAEKNIGINEYSFAAFLCQQAVEAGLKALYMLKMGKNAPKTHDLVLLSDTLKAPQNIRKIGERLSQSYMVSRYQGMTEKIPAEMYSEKDANAILVLAKEGMLWIKKELNL